MTEQERLQYAAKAAGINGTLAEDGNAIVVNTAPLRNYVLWNPRTNSQDSLRLMVKLNLVVECMVGQSAARTFDSKFAGCVDFPVAKKDSCNRAFTHDGASATREAIFRVAVALGKSMK